MKTLLIINASMRLKGSSTRAMTAYFEDAWLSANPDGQVIHRCLVTDPVPHLTQDAFEGFQLPLENKIESGIRKLGEFMNQLSNDIRHSKMRASNWLSHLLKLALSDIQKTTYS